MAAALLVPSAHLSNFIESVMKPVKTFAEIALSSLSLLLIASPPFRQWPVVLFWAVTWIAVAGNYLLKRHRQRVFSSELSTVPEELLRRPRTGLLTGVSIIIGSIAFLILCTQG